MYRASLVLIVLIVSALLGSGVRTLSPAAAQIDAQAGAGTRPVELLAGWNLVGWTGDDASVPDALGDALPAIDSVHTFDAARQAFDTFTTSGPGFLNTLDVILSGAGVWFFANTGVTWQQPRITGPATSSSSPASTSSPGPGPARSSAKRSPGSPGRWTPSSCGTPPPKSSSPSAPPAPPSSTASTPSSTATASGSG